MCESGAEPHDVLTSMPRVAAGTAVDPIALEPVDAIEITTLVDNVFDGLLTGDERTRRASSSSVVAAPQFETGRTKPEMITEHGYAALVTVRRAGRSTTLLFDTGRRHRRGAAEACAAADAAA
jgi:7,8-dihydropterin-6-yl-methyl-4-(beta-D-ribofuranosyl)aminobenzene 5'-phosphate synthase